MHFNSSQRVNKGFTLIEMVIGIVVFSIAFALITSLLLPSSEHSARQVQQIRAAELGQSMFNEILSKAFDDNSDMVGGLQRCGEVGFTACSTNLGRDGAETRANFNDVDDYQLRSTEMDDFNPVQDSLGNPLDLYQGFTVAVAVCNVSDFNGNCSNTATDFAKLIRITVTTPLGNSVVFASYKANF